MLTVHPEMVIGRDRKPRAVLLPYSEWNKVLADMEELDDIRAYDRAKARGDEAIPFEQAAKQMLVTASRPRFAPLAEKHRPCETSG